MVWLVVGVALLSLGSINLTSKRIAAANEDLLFIARYGVEAYERRQKMYRRCRTIVNGTLVFFGTLAITLMTSCAPIVPNYAYQASYTPNDPCAQYLTGKVSNDYVDCHARLREEAAKQRAEGERLANIRARQEAEANHICNGFAPDGCLSPEQKQANAQLVRNAQNAAACEYGDQAACRAYPGGPSEAMDEYHQMKLRDCFMSFDGLPDYYGTKHLACR